MPRLWPYDDTSGTIGHYFNLYNKGGTKFYETGYAGFLGINRANGHLIWQSAGTGSAAAAATLAAVLDLFAVNSLPVFVNVNGHGWDHDGTKSGSAIKVGSNANQGFLYVNAYYNSGTKYTRAGHAGRVNVDIQNGGIQFYTAPNGSQDAAMTETLQFSIDESGNCRAVGAVGHQHVGAATPTGGSSGDVKIGNGKIWVNDAGTWKSAAIA